jgi:Tol biopolymer transport system component
VDGGVAVAISPDQSNYGASWGPDDRIVYATFDDGIVRVSASGGTPEKIVKMKPGEAFHGPQMLPDGQHVLMTVTTAIGPDRWDQGQIVAQSISSGDRRVLIQGGRDARYLATGHLVYAVGTTIFAVAFDASALQVRGTPVAVLHGVRGTAGMNTGAAYFAVSDTGHLAYIPVSATASTGTAALVDTDGRLERSPLTVGQARISPDGSQVVATAEGAVWIYAGLTTNTAPRKLTLDGANDYPIWTPDGTRITYRSLLGSGHSAIVSQRADGRGGVDTLLSMNGFPFAWSGDQKTLYFYSRDAGRSGLWFWRAGEKPKELFASDWEGSLSPDGEWMAYHITENRKTMVYIQSLVDSSARFLVSKGGGHHPLWAPDGKRLFFVENGGNHLMVVPVQTKPSVMFGTPAPMVDGVQQILNNARNYDITPDGKRLLVQMIDEVSNPRAQEVDVVLNWTEELKRLVPTK